MAAYAEYTDCILYVYILLWKTQLRLQRKPRRRWEDEISLLVYQTIFLHLIALFIGVPTLKSASYSFAVYVYDPKEKVLDNMLFPLTIVLF